MTASTATDPQPEAEANELEVILAEPTRIDIIGIPMVVKRLKTREFLKLLRIFTEGFGGGLSQLAFADDSEELLGQLMGAFIAALPNAEEQVIDFIKAMVEPDGTLTVKQQKAVAVELANPDPEVTLRVFEVILDQEAEELTRLGKQAVAWWKASGIVDRVKNSDG